MMFREGGTSTGSATAAVSGGLQCLHSVVLTQTSVRSLVAEGLRRACQRACAGSLHIWRPHLTNPWVFGPGGQNVKHQTLPSIVQ